MAAQGIVIFSDGKIEIPLDLQQECHLSEGMQLRLTRSSGTLLIAEPLTSDDRSLGDARRDWRSYKGMLGGLPDHNTSRSRHQERTWELEHDERKLGPFPKQ